MTFLNIEFTFKYDKEVEKSLVFLWRRKGKLSNVVEKESEIVWSKFRMREEDVGSERVQSLVDRVSKSLAVSTVGRD